jgi:hypothetical protein
MTDYEPTSPHEAVPARPASGEASGPSVAASSGGAGAAPPREADDEFSRRYQGLAYGSK